MSEPTINVYAAGSRINTACQQQSYLLYDKHIGPYDLHYECDAYCATYFTFYPVLGFSDINGGIYKEEEWQKLEIIRQFDMYFIIQFQTGSQL